MKVIRAALGLLALAILLATAAGFFYVWQADQRETFPAHDIAPAGGRFVSGGDTEIFVQEAGPVDAPAVLFVHGTGAWSEAWRDAIDALAAAGYRVIALDLPPFGYSARPESGDYSPAAQGARIAAVLDSLGIARVTLVGHSFGSGATVEAALRNPARVQALVLVDAALDLPPDDGSARPSPSRLQHALLGGQTSARILREALVASFVTNPSFTRRALRSFIADPAVATDARVSIYQQPQRVTGTTRAVAAWLPSLLAADTHARSNDPAAYVALSMPALLLWGEADTVTPLAQGRRLAGLLPAAKLVVLPRIGHIPQIENPDDFNRNLLAFLDTRVRAPRQ